MPEKKKFQIHFVRMSYLANYMINNAITWCKDNNVAWMGYEDEIGSTYILTVQVTQDEYESLCKRLYLSPEKTMPENTAICI